METPGTYNIHVENIERLKSVKSLKDEAVEGLRVLRYILCFGLHCDLLHAGGSDRVKGVSVMYLSLPTNANHLTFHCDSAFLEISKIRVQVVHNEDDLPNNELLFASDSYEIVEKEYWEIDTSDIIYKCGPDSTTCIMALPTTLPFDNHPKGLPIVRESTLDWDECSTTESLDNVAMTGVHTLAVSFYFSARLVSVPEGLYLARDVGEVEGEDACTVVVATALEQLFARRVFPCLDIAQCKAPFSIRVALKAPCEEHTGVTVFSTTRIAQRLKVTPTPHNMLIRHLLPGLDNVADCELVVFEETIALPPYSVSLFYGLFELSSSHLLHSKRRRRSALVQCAVPVTNSRRSRLNGCILAHAWAQKVLTFLSETVFESLHCEVDKLTLIPLRCQRGLGLENHGCISLKEDFFLISNPAEVPILRVIRIYRLICHELCHQWIGNMFTPHEITDIWLKEGFVRFVEFLIVDALLESADARDLLWASFLFEVRAEAFIVDAGTFSVNVDNGVMPTQNHPVQAEVPLVTLNSLTSLFDSITYDKTAAVLMMWDIAFSHKGSQVRPESAGIVDATSRYPELSRSIFVPALVQTFVEVEKEGSYLFAPNSIWQCADVIRGCSQHAAPCADAEVWTNHGISSPEHITSPHELQTHEVLRPWLEQVGFPWLIWDVTEDDESFILAAEQASHAKGGEKLWTIPLAFLLEGADEDQSLFLPFVLCCKSQVFIVSKSTGIKSVSIVDGAKGFGFYLLTRGLSIAPSPQSWQSPYWQFANLCMAGMVLAICCSSTRRGESTIELWNQWRQLEENTREALGEGSVVLQLIVSRIQQCHKRGKGPDPFVLMRVVSMLRQECCGPCTEYGSLEIIHRSWTWLILGGLSWN